jgi:CRISPR/Cas system-associated endonuclease Cas1
MADLEKHLKHLRHLRIKRDMVDGRIQECERFFREVERWYKKDMELLKEIMEETQESIASVIDELDRKEGGES